MVTRVPTPSAHLFEVELPEVGQKRLDEGCRGDVLAHQGHPRVNLGFGLCVLFVGFD